jgi:hypothetical protein
MEKNMQRQTWHALDGCCYIGCSPGIIHYPLHGRVKQQINLWNRKISIKDGDCCYNY